ncbi:MAG TPA: LuxR C-terminal-related transcriptional regulator [Candidatus Elarobacter sp.]|jgi:DNA-binding CsgD family transcriptional regulator/putative methionine-R-sulfoxide reductase with GAF domain|nr:LuxR C-terminal-related transcriptional regulator [Candidatus Elarobacter sp.]
MAWFARRFDADSLLVGHRSGAVSELSDKTVLRRGRGLGGLVFASNSVRWVEDYLGSSHITHHYDGSIRAESLRRIIGAPVWADGDFFGVLMAGSREEGTFGTRAAAHLEDAARRTSDVLQAALLRERLTRLELATRETAAQLRALETRVGTSFGGIRGRERDVLAEVARGKTNREIATSLHVSECTVKSYLRHVMQRLGARNRAEAVIRAREAGF